MGFPGRVADKRNVSVWFWVAATTFVIMVVGGIMYIISVINAPLDPSQIKEPTIFPVPTAAIEGKAEGFLSNLDNIRHGRILKKMAVPPPAPAYQNTRLVVTGKNAVQTRYTTSKPAVNPADYYREK